MTDLTNAAVFQGGARRFKGVNVRFTDETVEVLNMNTGAVMSTFDIVEVAKEGEAWDVVSATDTNPVRLVAQLGCGCSGQKPYQVDPSYSGRIQGR